MTFLKFHSLLFSLRNASSVAAAQTADSSSTSLVTKLTKDNQYSILSDVITPLWKIDYKEQILLKKKWSKSVLNAIKTKHLPKVKTSLHYVIPSVQITQYRNKDTFNIHTGIDGNPKTVGYFIGSSAKGEVICVPPRNLIVLKEAHIEAAKVFQDLLGKSKLNACYQLNDGGFWRGITVTSNREGDILAVINAHPAGIPDGNIDEIKCNLVEHFQENLPAIKSLYIQLCPHTACTRIQAPFIHLSGEQYIYETIDRYIFRISPDSFLLPNVDTIPLLYESILNFADIDKTFTILDLNCSMGTFSVFASKYVRGCVGIDISASAIENAEFNAKNNGVHNCYFVQGNLEKSLKMVLKEHDSTLNMVAVINASKTGISKELVKILRRCVQLKRIIYISSKADSVTSMRSIIDLCHPKFDLSNGYNLTDIQPVDLYPNTNYCDLVMLFKR
ncbi:hypothetical protein O3M35_000021 [Rhynocoris fuscipes]|uniref:tRNA (uracil(54)-C(5))-methyltransferase n=1 Tax=Rhynocoris fuscipes TaxID=488301 RepID=A0AAW1DQB8_9HEMI